MAYKKNYRKKRRRRRGPPRSRYQNYAGAAKQLYRDVRKLKDLVNVETKMVETVSTIGTIDWNGGILTMNALLQGDTESTRDGSSVKIQNLQCSGAIQFLQGITGAYRLVVVWDESASITSTNNFFQTIGTAQSPYGYKNWDNRFKSKILYDKLIINRPIDASHSTLHHVQFDVPVNKHTQYSDASGTISSGALRVIMITDQSLTNNIFNRLTFRLKYTDN